MYLCTSVTMVESNSDWSKVHPSRQASVSTAEVRSAGGAVEFISSWCHWGVTYLHRMTPQITIYISIHTYICIYAVYIYIYMLSFPYSCPSHIPHLLASYLLHLSSDVPEASSGMKTLRSCRSVTCNQRQRPIRVLR